MDEQDKAPKTWPGNRETQRDEKTVHSHKGIYRQYKADIKCKVPRRVD